MKERVRALEQENCRLRAAIAEARAHLGAALVQTIRTDDQIIMEHVRSAYRELVHSRLAPTTDDLNDPTDLRMQAEEDAMTRDLARTADGRPR